MRRPAEEQSWQRIELWPTAIICVEGGARRRPGVTVRNSDPRPGRWEADVRLWQAARPRPDVAESLHATAAVACDELDPHGRLSLEDSAALELFLLAWATHLSNRQPAVPCVVPPARPMSDGARRSIAVVMAILALAACCGASLPCRRGRPGGRPRRRGCGHRPTGRQLKTEADKLQTRREELKTACRRLHDDLEHYDQVLRAQRLRVASLLEVLARHGPDDIVIRKIDGSENEIVLRGLCLRMELADGLAETLARELGPQGWQVEPPVRHSREMLVAGGPWEFELRIKDQPPVAQEKPAAGPTHGRRP